jgi:hypothetical protein
MYTIKWTEEKKDKAIKILTKYFEKYGVGECIMQNDNAIIYASELLSEIADDVPVEGDGVNWNEED